MTASPAPLPHTLGPCSWHGVGTFGCYWGRWGTRDWCQGEEKCSSDWRNEEIQDQWSANPNPLSPAAAKTESLWIMPSLPKEESFWWIHIWVHIQFWFITVYIQINSTDVNNQPYSCTHIILKFCLVICIWESLKKSKKLLTNLADLQLKLPVFWFLQNTITEDINSKIGCM